MSTASPNPAPRSTSDPTVGDPTPVEERHASSGGTVDAPHETTGQGDSPVRDVAAGVAHGGGPERSDGGDAADLSRTDADDARPEQAAAVPTVESVPQARRVRRAPNFVPFMVTGAVLGFVVGALIERFGLPFVDTTPEFGEQMSSLTYSATTSVGFLGVLGALFGLLVATVIALVLDRRS